MMTGCQELHMPCHGETRCRERVVAQAMMVDPGMI